MNTQQVTHNTNAHKQRGEHLMTPKVRIAVELPVKDAEALEKLQRKHGWTRAEFIRAGMLAITLQDAQIDSKGKKSA